MSEWSDQTNHNALDELLADPIVIRIVEILNLASLSILELLEYGLSRHDINRAFSKGVIAFDRSTLPSEASTVENDVLISSDFYFKFLSGKVRLTELGIFILETVEGNKQELRHPPRFTEERELSLGPRGPMF